MKETQLFFESKGHQLFGMLYEPDSSPSEKIVAGYIICHPFAEEKKSAQKTLVDMARHLQQQGAYVLLFDFSGCGESEGKLKNTSISQWITETEDAASLLNEDYGVTAIHIIGLRLGAYIAQRAAERIEYLAHIVLIEPVTDPKRYLKSELRSKLMKELITNGVVSKNRNELIDEVKKAKSIDFDGHEISQGFYKDLTTQRKLKEIVLGSKMNTPILIINITPSGNMSREFIRLKIEIESHSEFIAFELIRFESFWYRTGPLDTDGFVASVSKHLIKNQTTVPE